MKFITSILAGVFIFISAGTAIAQENLPLNPPPYSNDFMMDNKPYLFLIADRLEYNITGSPNPVAWDITGWYGTDLNKFWFQTEGNVLTGVTEGEIEFQALYARTITSYFNAQVGIRYDVAYYRGESQTRGFAVISLEGLAPYFLSVDASAYISEAADISADFEVEYELPITQRLWLQPRAATAVALQDVKKWGVGAGFNYVQLGLRLRYEFIREFAPYIGISWNRKLGGTADFARAAGEEVSIFSLVGGVRMWF